MRGRAKAVAIGASVCLAAIVAAALAQQGPKPGSADPVIGLPGNIDVKSREPVLVNMSGGIAIPPEKLIEDNLREWKEAANASRRAEVEKALREALKLAFQARLGAHQKEIEQLEAKVKQLREQLELRRNKQDEIVDFRLQQLLREAQGLGWGTEPAVGLPPFPEVGIQGQPRSAGRFPSDRASNTAAGALSNLGSLPATLITPGDKGGDRGVSPGPAAPAPGPVNVPQKH